MDFDEEHWLWLYLQNYQNLNFDTIINRGLILGCKNFRSFKQKTKKLTWVSYLNTVQQTKTNQFSNKTEVKYIVLVFLLILVMFDNNNICENYPKIKNIGKCFQRI